MLIGNPADFDRIRARYEALSYPTPAEASFNAVRSNYEGLLTGSGFDTQMTSTTTPGQQVSFAVDPTTGQVTTQIPQYDVPTFENIYDIGEGLIGSDGLPKNIGGSSMASGQALPVVAQRSGGGGENFRNRSANIDTRNFGQLASDVTNSKFRTALLGAINPAFGLLNELSTMSDRNTLKDFGINTNVATQQIADVYNKAIKDGRDPGQALRDATIMGGVALTDKAFQDAGIPELSINQQLADFQAKQEPKGNQGGNQGGNFRDNQGGNKGGGLSAGAVSGSKPGAAAGFRP